MGASPETDVGLTVVGWLEVNPQERATWLDHAKAIVIATRNEPGVVAYAIGADLAEPGRIIFYERYRNPRAFQDHVHSEHFKSFMTNVQDIATVADLSFVTHYDDRPFDLFLPG